MQKEISFLTTEQRIQQTSFQQKIKLLEKEFQEEICSDVPNAFWVNSARHRVQAKHICQRLMPQQSYQLTAQLDNKGYATFVTSHST